jgi:hypothetical protein
MDKCRKPVKLTPIEPHPTRRDLAIQKLQCVDCGYVKAKIYSLGSARFAACTGSLGHPSIPPSALVAEAVIAELVADVLR